MKCLNFTSSILFYLVNAQDCWLPNLELAAGGYAFTVDIRYAGAIGVNSSMNWWAASSRLPLAHAATDTAT